MDILAHTLWSGALAKVAKKRNFLIKSVGWAAFFGVAPDFLAFGPYLIVRILTVGFSPPFPMGSEPPSDAFMPQYVKELYHVSHSLIIFSAVFFLVWLIRKKPYWEFFAWALHILIDIPTHTSQFFPTPFLWPINNFEVSGISWGTPWFMVLNYTLLAIVYIYLYISVRRRRENAARAL